MKAHVVTGIGIVLLIVGAFGLALTSRDVFLAIGLGGNSFFGRFNFSAAIVDAVVTAIFLAGGISMTNSLLSREKPRKVAMGIAAVMILWGSYAATIY